MLFNYYYVIANICRFRSDYKMQIVYGVSKEYGHKISHCSLGESGVKAQLKLTRPKSFYWQWVY